MFPLPVPAGSALLRQDEPLQSVPAGNGDSLHLSGFARQVPSTRRVHGRAVSIRYTMNGISPVRRHYEPECRAHSTENLPY